MTHSLPYATANRVGISKNTACSISYMTNPVLVNVTLGSSATKALISSTTFSRVIPMAELECIDVGERLPHHKTPGEKCGRCHYAAERGEFGNRQLTIVN